MNRSKQLKTTFSTAIFLLIASLSSNQALAGWGAIAYSPSSGTVGYSDGYGSYDEAINAAISACGYGDCSIKNWEHNRCNAFATGPGRWGEANGYANSSDAVDAAMSACGPSCNYNRWICD